MGSVVAAYTVAWCILIGYVLTLARRQQHLRQAVEKLQAETRTETHAG